MGYGLISISKVWLSTGRKTITWWRSLLWKLTKSSKKNFYTLQLTIALNVCAFCVASRAFTAWMRFTCEGWWSDCVWLSGRDWINSCRSCNGGNSPGSVMGFPSSRWKMLLGRIRGGWLSKLSRILAKTKNIFAVRHRESQRAFKTSFEPFIRRPPLIMNHPMLKRLIESNTDTVF